MGDMPFGVKSAGQLGGRIEGIFSGRRVPPQFYATFDVTGEPGDGARGEAVMPRRPGCGAARHGRIHSMVAPRADIPPDWLADFEAAARRPLRQRWKYALIKTHKPVLDDGETRFRAFETTADYRRWCEANLPRFLGYHRAV